MSISSTKSVAVTDIHFEVLQVRLSLNNIKSILESLNLLMNIRFTHLIKLIAMTKPLATSVHSGEEVIHDFTDLELDLWTLQKKIIQFLRKAEIGLKINRFSLATEKNILIFQQSRKSGTSDVTTFIHNLNALSNILKNSEKENERLLNENKLLTTEIVDVMHLNVEGITPVEEEKCISIDSTKSTTKERTVSTTLKQIIFFGTRSGVTSTDSLEFPDVKSLVELAPSDKSLNVDQSETRELSDEEWKIELQRIKDIHYQMVATELKLVTVKALILYGSVFSFK